MRWLNSSDADIERNSVQLLSSGSFTAILKPPITKAILWCAGGLDLCLCVRACVRACFTITFLTTFGSHMAVKVRPTLYQHPTHTHTSACDYFKVQP